MKNAIVTLLACFALLAFPIASQAEPSFSRESMVYITTFSNVSLTAKDPKIKDLVKFEDTISGGGTGVIVEHKDDITFIMSAGHVCDVLFLSQKKQIFPMYDPEKHDFSSKTLALVSDIDGDIRPAFIFGISRNFDVCVLITERMDKKPMKFSSRAPNPGEKVYSMGFPAGSYAPGVVPIFEGYYAGKDKSGLFALNVFTIPTKGGSSGSPVFLNDGGIVGIATNGNQYFEGWQGCVTYEQLVEFYKFFISVYAENKSEIIQKLSGLVSDIGDPTKLFKPSYETPPIPEKPDAKLPPVPGFE